MAENKKDAFTFSDKIKNSKPAFNPFSKRASSKIGNNGKPKKTIFDRTRRDAPFFIAAAAALLMLPFLYKYSGNVGDESPIVAPGMADTVFDPERFDFSPSSEDPSGQIAQLAGRDPLSLIKAWGSDEEPRYDEERDGFTDYSGGANTTRTTRRSDSSYRRTAPAATRAAFQRTPAAATKIGELRSSSINSRGGSGPGGRFGGSNLKSAANKSSAGPVRNPTKPVSLQPLRAAGNPSRSYYGMDNVARARASRDALSKANAVQGLKDAVFNPIGQGRLGGLTEGALAALGGGAGNLNRDMDYKGMTPWWWDMMKQREQEKWNFRYHLFRDPLKNSINAWLPKVLNCLAVGDPDGDLDDFWGKSGAPEKEGCKSYGYVFSFEEGRSKWGADSKLNFPESPKKYKDWCNDHSKELHVSWNKGAPASDGTGFFSQRLSMCTGNKWWKKKNKNGNNGGNGGGGAPAKCDSNYDGIARDKYQCASVNNPNFAQGISYEMELGKDYCNADSVLTVEVYNNLFLSDGTAQKLCGEKPLSCVLYVAEGGTLDWGAARKEMIATLGKKFPNENSEELFRQLLFAQVRGFVLEKGQKVEVPELPFASADTFEWGIAPKEATCAFPSFQIKAKPITDPEHEVGALLTYYGFIDQDHSFDYSYIDVRAAETDKSKVADAKPEQPVEGGVKTNDKFGMAQYNMLGSLPAEDASKVLEDLKKDTTNFTWTAAFNDQTSSDSVTYDANGQVVPPGDDVNPTDVIDMAGVYKEIDDEFNNAIVPDDELIPLPTDVFLVGRLNNIPSEKDVFNPQKRTDKNPQGRWANCKADMNEMGLRALAGGKSGEATAIIEEAINAYNKEVLESETKTKMRDFGAGRSVGYSVGEVLDALTILKHNGMQAVSKNLACTIAKTVGANSKDPHAGNMNNMFGAFAAFIDGNSSFFPGSVLADGKTDPRFHGCDGAKQTAAGPGPEYHYGHYNWSSLSVGDQANNKDAKSRQDGRQPYEQVLKSGAWGSFPLAELKKDFNYYSSVKSRKEVIKLGSSNGTIDDLNRKMYYEAYADVFWNDTACEGYGNETMSLENLFVYIDKLCENGTQIKPANAPEGKSLPCVAKFQKSTLREPATGNL